MKFDYLETVTSIPLNFNGGGVSRGDREVIVSIGKSAAFMYERYCREFPSCIDKNALVILPEGIKFKPFSENCSVFYSTHPYITEKSFAASRKLYDFMDNNRPSVVTVLLSGGSSALLEHSKEPQLTMEVNRKLLDSGLDIVSVNKERINNSLIKGGKFAESCPDIFFRVFVMSDIPFEEGEKFVGSNPFFREDLENTVLIKCADSNTLHDHILEKCSFLKKENTVSIRMFNGSIDELIEIVMRHISNSNSDLLVTGEPTVRIKGNKGIGGRMSHFALQLLPHIGKYGSLYALSSDGIDGNSPFAGVVIEKKPYNYSSYDAQSALRRYDSARYFDRLGCSLKTGYTGINMNDFVIVLRK